MVLFLGIFVFFSVHSSYITESKVMVRPRSIYVYTAGSNDIYQYEPCDIPGVLDESQIPSPFNRSVHLFTQSPVTSGQSTPRTSRIVNRPERSLLVCACCFTATVSATVTAVLMWKYWE